MGILMPSAEQRLGCYLNFEGDLEMTVESRDYLEMAFHSVQCFANDGKLLVDELDQILQIALRDGVVDDNEKRILRNIFSRLTPSELTQEMQDKIKQIRADHQI